MLTKSIEPTAISVRMDGRLEVRMDTVILEDGVEISRVPHREVVNPGDDVSNKHQRVKDIAGLVHTPQVVKNFRMAEAVRQANV